MRLVMDEKPDDEGVIARMAQAMREAFPARYETLARVALVAARSPTGAMKDAGAGTFQSTGSNQFQLDGQPTKCWQAMIDTILAEPLK